jgi:hypothetical protein
MATRQNHSAAKRSIGKTFLSVLFFLLILGSSGVLAVQLRLSACVGQPVVDAILGSDPLWYRFLTGTVGLWCTLCAVLLWFVLWMVTTKRILCALRGLGIACSIAALGELLLGVIALLLTCVFSVESKLLPYAETLPTLYTRTCGKNVIFALCSLIVASVGIFLCKVRALHRKKGEHTAADVYASKAPEAEPAPASEPIHASAPEPAPEAATFSPKPEPAVDTMTAAAEKTDAVTPPPASAQKAETPEIDLHALDGVCHNCGAKNAAGVNFCGFCGAKLL